MSTCHHGPADAYYMPGAPNETGWKCACGELLGFRPDLDHRRLEDKVYGLLLELHERKFLYVSNGTMSMVITDNVATRCVREDRYDQLSILLFILEDGNLDVAGHAKFWREQARQPDAGVEVRKAR